MVSKVVLECINGLTNLLIGASGKIMNFMGTVNTSGTTGVSIMVIGRII